MKDRPPQKPSGLNASRSQIIRGSGANSLNLGARLVEQIFLVPVLLSAWSVELYGEWIILSTIPVFLSLSDMGFITAGSNELARRASVETDQSVKRFFSDYTQAFLRWSLIILAILAVVAMASPIDRWLSLSLIEQQEAQLTFLLLVASMLTSQNSMTMLAGLRARRRFHLGLLIRANAALTRIFTTFLVVLLWNGGPVAVASVFLAVGVAEWMVQVTMLCRQDLSPSFALFRRTSEPLGRYLKIGLEYLLMPAAQGVVFQGTIVLVGVSLGSSAAAVFATHRTITRMTSQVLQLAVAPLRNEVGLLQADDERSVLASLLGSVSALTFWASLGSGAILFAVGPFLFQLWTGGEIEFMPGLFGFLVLSTILEGVWRVASTVRLGTNRHKPLVWGYFTLSLAGLGIAYILSQTLGISAVAFAVMLVDLSMCILTIHFTVSFLDMTARSYVAKALSPPVKEFRALCCALLKRLQK